MNLEPKILVSPEKVRDFTRFYRLVLYSAPNTEVFSLYFRYSWLQSMQNRPNDVEFPRKICYFCKTKDRSGEFQRFFDGFLGLSGGENLLKMLKFTGFQLKDADFLDFSASKSYKPLKNPFLWDKEDPLSQSEYPLMMKIEEKEEKERDFGLKAGISQWVLRKIELVWLRELRKAQFLGFLSQKLAIFSGNMLEKEAKMLVLPVKKAQISAFEAGSYDLLYSSDGVQ